MSYNFRYLLLTGFTFICIRARGRVCARLCARACARVCTCAGVRVRVSLFIRIRFRALPVYLVLIFGPVYRSGQISPGFYFCVFVWFFVFDFFTWLTVPGSLKIFLFFFVFFCCRVNYLFIFGYH